MSGPKKEGTDYRPISCASHDVFELAILRHAQLHLTWVEDNILHTQIVTPLDIETANHEEFLLAQLASGQTLRLRLDRIREVRTT
ncbi:MAG: Rho-binding antiterminator [Acidiferrobacterales bacterium]